MITIWTLVAVILHFVGLGAFANWPVIAGPFTWSCMCLFIWEWLVMLIALLLYIFFGVLGVWRRKQ